MAWKPKSGGHRRPQASPALGLGPEVSLPSPVACDDQASPRWGQVALASPAAQWTSGSSWRSLTSDGFSEGAKSPPKPGSSPPRISPGRKKSNPFLQKEKSLFRFPNETSPGPKIVLDEECVLPSHPARQPLPPFLFSPLQPVRWELSGEKSHIMQ